METIFGWLKGLSASQRLMWLGNAGLVISSVSTGIFHVQIVEGMNMYVFLACAVFTVLGWAGSQWDQQRAFDIKMEDAKLREKKIDAGMDPALDKTIIRYSNDD